MSPDEELTIYTLERGDDKHVIQESLATIGLTLQSDEHLVKLPTRLYYPLLEAVAVMGEEDLIALLGKLGAETVTEVRLEVDHRPEELTIRVGARRSA